MTTTTNSDHEKPRRRKTTETNDDHKLPLTKTTTTYWTWQNHGAVWMSRQFRWQRTRVLIVLSKLDSWNYVVSTGYRLGCRRVEGSWTYCVCQSSSSGLVRVGWPSASVGGCTSPIFRIIASKGSLLRNTRFQCLQQSILWETIIYVCPCVCVTSCYSPCMKLCDTTIADMVVFMG